MKIFFNLLVFCFAVFIISCNPEGKLPQPENSDTYPVVSPDGKYIVYSHWGAFDNYQNKLNNYATGLYIMDIDGKNRRLLVKDYNNGLNGSSWSPDSKFLVISNPMLKVIDTDGKIIDTMKVVLPFGTINPYWSRDGSLVLFSENFSGKRGLYFTNRNLNYSRKIINVTSTARDFPKLSLDNSHLLFQNEGVIVSADTSSVNISALTKVGQYETDEQASWSPDEKTIVYQHISDIFLMNSDGTNNHLFELNGINPTFTPDGKSIICSKPSTDFNNYYLWKVDISTGQRIQLTF